jgi:hypothetical protein
MTGLSAHDGLSHLRLDRIFCYLEDILVTSPDERSHRNYYELVFGMIEAVWAGPIMGEVFFLPILGGVFGPLYLCYWYPPIVGQD